MGKFKVGDRVAVYGHTRRTPYSCDLPTRYMRGSKGEVSCVLNHDELMIQFDDGSETEVHPKQCRRLVKKESKVRTKANEVSGSEESAARRTIAGGGTLKLEVGKRYRTRDGKIATCTEAPEGASEGHVVRFPDGTFFINPDGTCPPSLFHRDLVELVSEERNWEAEVNRTTTESESELARLVRVANDGAAAERVLKAKYVDQLEAKFFSGSGKESGWDKASAGPGTYEYRIKPAPPKPAFEPFVLDQGNSRGHWTVEHLPETGQVKIGCQVFQAAELLTALENICSGDINQWAIGANVIYSKGSKGIEWKGHKLSWADADRLLEALRRIPQVKEVA